MVVFLFFYSDKLVVLYFRADWAPQCKQVDDLMPDLVKDKELDRTSFYKVVFNCTGSR